MSGFVAHLPSSAFQSSRVSLENEQIAAGKKCAAEKADKAMACADAEMILGLVGSLVSVASAVEPAQDGGTVARNEESHSPSRTDLTRTVPDGGLHAVAQRAVETAPMANGGSENSDADHSSDAKGAIKKFLQAMSDMSEPWWRK